MAADRRGIFYCLSGENGYNHERKSTPKEERSGHNVSEISSFYDLMMQGFDLERVRMRLAARKVMVSAPKDVQIAVMAEQGGVRDPLSGLLKRCFRRLQVFDDSVASPAGGIFWKRRYVDSSGEVLSGWIDPHTGQILSDDQVVSRFEKGRQEEKDLAAWFARFDERMALRFRSRIISRPSYQRYAAFLKFATEDLFDSGFSSAAFLSDSPDDVSGEVETRSVEASDSVHGVAALLHEDFFNSLRFWKNNPHRSLSQPEIDSVFPGRVSAESSEPVKVCAGMVIFSIRNGPVFSLGPDFSGIWNEGIMHVGRKGSGFFLHGYDHSSGFCVIAGDLCWWKEGAEWTTRPGFLGYLSSLIAQRAIEQGILHPADFLSVFSGSGYGQSDRLPSFLDRVPPTVDAEVVPTVQSHIAYDVECDCLVSPVDETDEDFAFMDDDDLLRFFETQDPSGHAVSQEDCQEFSVLPAAAGADVFWEWAQSNLECAVVCSSDLSVVRMDLGCFQTWFVNEKTPV